MSKVTSLDQNAVGSLSETRLIDVLLELESSKSDVRVWFETESGLGEVLMHQGTVVQARLGGAKGRTALLRLLSANEGRFGVEHCSISEDKALVANVSALIDLHNSRQEEWKVLCSRSPPLSSILKLSAVGVDVRDASRGMQRVIFVLMDGQRTLMQVLEESSFDPVDGLKLVIKAVDDGLLVHAPQATTLFPSAPNADGSGVIPRFTAPTPVPRLDPEIPTPFGGAPNWRNATLVGIGKRNLSKNTSDPDITRSPIIDLDPHTSKSAQPPLTLGAGFPSRTKTVMQGFGSGLASGLFRPDMPLPTQTSDEDGSLVEPVASAHGGVIDGRTIVQLDGAEQPKQAAYTTEPTRDKPAETGLASEAFPTTPVKGDALRRFVDRYEILLRIGRGGMGTVYLCRLSSVDVSFRRLFALKLLRSHLSQDTQAAKDFLEEARVAGYLHHPNVVAVLDAGFHGKQPYLVMDYVEGCSLKQLTKGSPRCTPYFLLPIIIDVLAGLHSAHTLQDETGTDFKLVHCDVSPENILVGANGTSRLTDFGVARRANLSLGSTTRGKPGYVSPEQVAGHSFDHRADIFSVGVVLWNALTGQKLFVGNTVEETLEQVCSKPIPPPSQFGADSNPELDQLILRALSRDPRNRFSSAQDMLAELRSVANKTWGLANPVEIASWVRDAFGNELTERRLAILDASRLPTIPPPAETQAFTDFAPPSVPFSAVPNSEPPDLNAHTLALTRSSNSSTRTMLLLAGVLALVAVIATVAFPRKVAKLLRVSTDAVQSRGPVSVDMGSLAATSSETAGLSTTAPPRTSKPELKGTDHDRVSPSSSSRMNSAGRPIDEIQNP